MREAGVLVRLPALLATEEREVQLAAAMAASNLALNTANMKEMEQVVLVLVILAEDPTRGYNYQLKAVFCNLGFGCMRYLFILQRPRYLFILQRPSKFLGLPSLEVIASQAMRARLYCKCQLPIKPWATSGYLLRIQNCVIHSYPAVSVSFLYSQPAFHKLSCAFKGMKSNLKCIVWSTFSFQVSLHSKSWKSSILKTRLFCLCHPFLIPRL